MSVEDLDPPELEHEVLEFWDEIDAFEKSVARNKGNEKWSFMDGPITANNPMGVHHAWGRAYKDLFLRYKAMRGFDLRHQNGFDCQGLWIEVEVEKELGFKSKRDIEAFGVDEFVKRCKQRVLRYAAVQTEQSIRMGHWMDWDDPDTLRSLAEKLEDPQQKVMVESKDGEVTGTAEEIVGELGSRRLGGSYFTFSDQNNYTIWAALKKCHEKGWIYMGEDVMPWCPRCSTALSQHEIATEGYEELTHPGVTLRFPLVERPGESLLVWTTTPWTLTSNVAVAVHPDLVYVKLRYDGELLYLGEFALDRILSDEDFEVVEELKGSELEGLSFDGPFDELSAEREKGAVEAHRVILWDQVTEEEGTGFVHIAPGCGKEDLELAEEHELPAVAPLDEFGVFKEGFGDLTGTHVYDSAEPVIESLKEKGLLFNVEDYTHRYPVCWRCSSELVFRLVEEWFISMGAKLDKAREEVTEEEKSHNLRYQIMDVAEDVRWIPEFGLRQELNWLENMEDWMISKKRYWGLALPIWVCDECGEFDVVGGKEELRKRAVDGWDEFDGHSPHRPWIDAVKIGCTECGGVSSRIEDVGNPWLDAGIVSYSTLDYWEDREYWKEWFPADFVCESLRQQYRNWFYAMLAESTIMEKRTPFKTCFGYGVVLAEDGREMHKSWGNTIWFNEAVERMGADVMRWMYFSTRPETNLLFGYNKADETKRRFLIPLWNIHSFFVTYAELDEWAPKSSSDEAVLSSLDRWILSKLNVLIEDVTKDLEGFDPYGAAHAIEEFVNELSTWYVRRSRRRFWKSEKDLDKDAAYSTLYTCLTSLLKLLAPFLPFTTEKIYQNVCRELDPHSPVSVHLNDWPEADRDLIDAKLMEDMDLVVRVCSLGRSARNSAGVKLRQPLGKVGVVASESDLDPVKELMDIVVEELNVKEVSLTTDRTRFLDYVLNARPDLLGKKYGGMFPRISDALDRLDAEEAASAIEQGRSIEVMVDGESFELLPEEVDVQTQPKEGYSLSEEEDLAVAVDTRLTPGLRKEGLARDIVRRIQNQRKESGFDIDDRIETYYQAGSELTEVFKDFREYISTETLSQRIHKDEPPEGSHVSEYEIDGMSLEIGLRRV